MINKKIYLSEDNKEWLRFPFEYWDENWKKGKGKDKKTELEIDTQIIINAMTNKPMKDIGILGQCVDYRDLKRYFHLCIPIKISVYEDQDKEGEDIADEIFELLTFNIVVFNCSYEKSPFIMSLKLKFKSI